MLLPFPAAQALKRLLSPAHSSCLLLDFKLACTHLLFALLTADRRASESVDANMCYH